MTRHPILRPLAVALVAAACAPSVPHGNPPSSVVTAVFDPTAGKIPLPNDLALQAPPSNLPKAQAELLKAFAAQGGFPNDQEVPVTIAFTRTNINADGTTSNVAPNLDVTTLTPATLAVFLKTATGAGTVALDPIQPSDYVVPPPTPGASGQGVLTLHNKNRQPWTPGEYVVAVRGGPNGVKTKEGDPVYASQVFYLIAQGQQLNTEQNLGLLRAQAGSTAAAQQLANQLDLVIALYTQKGGAFAAVNQVFPHQELAAMTTFAVAPLATQVQLDPNRRLVPLPIDLLRDPRPRSPTCAACGHLTPLAACTLAQGTFDKASGACTDAHGNPDAAAAGFATLDGFSTTGMMLAPTSDLVQASTVNGNTVLLFDLTNPAQPALVDPATYINEPCEVTSSCSDHPSALSPTIALQPAGATAYDNGGSPLPSVFRTRPLKDDTDYAVVIGDGVKDKAGNPLHAGTVAQILQFTNPLVDASQHSQLLGVDDSTAGALEVMRQKLVPVLAAAGGKGIGQGHVAMAYTFHTESITQVATQLGALPYTQPAVTAVTGPIASETPAAAFSRYGVDASAVPGTAPTDNIHEVLETTITTFNLLDPATGAFLSDPTRATAETVNVLIATPKAGTAPACAGAMAPFAPAECSPMVVFRHGLGGGRAQMLTVADTLTARGFTVVAIDAAKHGDRSFCTSGQATTSLPGTAVPQCARTDVCLATLPAGAQGDAAPVGCCVPAGTTADPTSYPASCGVSPPFAYRPVSNSCLASPGACGWTGMEGIPYVSSNYLVTANFFRTRDTLRQDIIDESQLVRAVAFVPSGPPPTFPNPIFQYMFNQASRGTGVIIDPQTVYFLGQSLGAIQGTVDVAANPRFSKAVLNVGGGTVVDVFTNSPSFVAGTRRLLQSIGVQPGANAGYLQFLVVAKTILDPADPVNFAPHLTANTLPDLLRDQTGRTPQAAKSVLAQAAFCDQVVPNPFNFILDATMGTGPQLPDPSFGGPGTFELFYTGTSAPGAAALSACPAPPADGSGTRGAVTHGFITDWNVDGAMTFAGQSDAAAFLSAGTHPPSLRVVP